jgi:CheY-like chemotaxis protein
MPRVLVVDDEEAIRETLRFVLEDAGYSVVEAMNGLDALDILYASIEPLVVLLDIMMPRLNGAGVLGVAAEDEQLASQNAFVLVTANPAPFSKPFALLVERLGVAVVSKPFDIDDLLSAIAQAARHLPARHWYLGGYADAARLEQQG